MTVATPKRKAMKEPPAIAVPAEAQEFDLFGPEPLAAPPIGPSKESPVDKRSRAKKAPAETPPPAKTKPEAVAGVRCRKCNSALCPVHYTRHRPGKTVRKRICGHCGHEFVTYEKLG